MVDCSFGYRPHDSKAGDAIVGDSEAEDFDGRDFVAEGFNVSRMTAITI